MMKDYTELYPGKTPLDARYQYARDLLRRYCRGPYGNEPLVLNPCKHCDFPRRMDGGPIICCGWALDADPEKAIRVLEDLLDIPFKPEYDTADNVSKIAGHNGTETVLYLLQEECAELIQAASKWLRDAFGDSERAKDHVCEEMADVYILLDELVILHPELGRSVLRWRDEKVKRTLDRLDISEPGADEISPGAWNKALAKDTNAPDKED